MERNYTILRTRIQACREGRVNQELTDQERRTLFARLSGRARIETRERLWRRINLPLSLWPDEYLLQRVIFRDGIAEYIAGQDYPTEIRRVRHILLGA